MITCPTCGNSVPENQRFCGRCGTDVRAATSTYSSSGSNPAPEPPPGDTGYGYEPGAYGYAPARERRPSMAVLGLIIAGVALVCLCCGIVLGGAGWYMLGPVSTPVAPTVAPTPEGLIRLIFMI